MDELISDQLVLLWMACTLADIVNVNCCCLEAFENIGLSLSLRRNIEYLCFIYYGDGLELISNSLV